MPRRSRTTIEDENSQETQVGQEPIPMEEQAAPVEPIPIQEEQSAANEPTQAYDEQVATGELMPAMQEACAAPQMALSVRINSLELDGDTRAFATAEYGDLTIRRIRVKDDGWGGLFVAMPKFRQTTGYTETCFFSTPESKERFQNAVLDVYHQTLEQMRTQSPEQTLTEDMEYEQEDSFELDEGGQDQGISMDM